jgi:hypothetical protein
VQYLIYDNELLQEQKEENFRVVNRLEEQLQSERVVHKFDPEKAKEDARKARATSEVEHVKQSRDLWGLGYAANSAD